MLATNAYAYCSWIQGEESTKHPYPPTSVGTKVSSDSVHKGYSQRFQASTLNDQGMNYYVYMIPPKDSGWLDQQMTLYTFPATTSQL